MRRFFGLLVIVIFGVLLVPLGKARPEYAKKTGKKCADCHVHGNPKELTDMGKYYKEHNHSLDGYKDPEKKE